MYQQAAQPSPPAAQSGGSAAGLVGTWEMTHSQGEPVDPGTGTQTYSEDGTFQSTSFGLITLTGQYSVLDDSRIQFTADGESGPAQEYSLEGDTLTFYVEDPEFPIQQTWQRTN